MTIDRVNQNNAVILSAHTIGGSIFELSRARARDSHFTQIDVQGVDHELSLSAKNEKFHWIY